MLHSNFGLNFYRYFQKYKLLEVPIKNWNLDGMLYCAELHRKGEAEYPFLFPNLVISDFKQ